MVIVEGKERRHLGFHVWSYPVRESSNLFVVEDGTHLGLRDHIKGELNKQQGPCHACHGGGPLGKGG